MKKVIYKYPVNEKYFEQSISLPARAQILSAGFDPKGDLCLWALVDLKAELQQHTVYIMPTGYEFDMKKVVEFIDTVKSGPHMWHIFISL